MYWRLEPSGAVRMIMTRWRSSDGAYSLAVALEGGPGPLTQARSLQVARRTTERLLVSATLDQEVIAPGAALTGRVTVRTPSGAPVIGATVVLAMPRAEAQTVATGEDGTVAFRITAPLFLAGPFEAQTLAVRVSHGAHGTLAIGVPYTLARTEYRVSLVAANHHLVPEVASSVFVQVTNLRGQPAPAGTSVEVSGPGVAQGTRVEADADGIAEVPVRIPLGAAGRVDAAHPAMPE